MRGMKFESHLVVRPEPALIERVRHARGANATFLDFAAGDRPGFPLLRDARMSQ